MSDKKKQTEDELLEEVTSSEYKYGFTTDIESDTIPKGLSEDVVRTISADIVRTTSSERPLGIVSDSISVVKPYLYSEEVTSSNNSSSVCFFLSLIHLIIKEKNFLHNHKFYLHLDY